MTVVSFARRACFVVLAAGLGACATVPNSVDNRQAFWAQGGETAVAHVAWPTPDAHRVGAEGLLDMAINSAITGGVRGHLAEVDLTDTYAALLTDLQAELTARGVPTKIVERPVDPTLLPKFEGAKKGEDALVDMRRWRNRFDADYLCLVHVAASGTMRPYYGFVPTGRPTGFSSVGVEIVDLRTNALVWRYATQVSREIPGEWDVKPDYPNLTESVGEAAEDMRGKVVKAFRTDGVVADAP